MKRVAVLGALVAASLLAGSAAMAHDRGEFGHREPPRVGGSIYRLMLFQYGR
jgi:hypothetical protein